MKTNVIAVKTNALLFAVALLFIWSEAIAWAQTNLVANGSFEAGPAGEGVFTDWNWLGPADGNSSDYGVAQSTSGFDVAEQGNYYAYFRGHPTDNSQDCLGTGMRLKLGGLYNVSYYLGSDGPLTNGAAMWVVIGPSFGIDYSQDVSLTQYFPYSATALPYQKFSTIYLATNTSPILSFHGINATNGVAVTNGILLDNVSMVLAYPPLKLNYSRPTTLAFTWPFTNSPYRLQSAPTLTATSWTTLTNLPVNLGTNNQIALTGATNQTLFYRLTLP